MVFRDESIMEPNEACMLNGLQLAYIGDTVWETMVRLHMIMKGLNVNHMHHETIGYVNAHAQAEFLNMVIGELNEQEMDIVRRGRNAHSRHTAPRNQNQEDYSASTGFEAMLGYLYLTGEHERLNTIFQRTVGVVENG